MKELDIVIQNPTGLHARPAKVFVNTAKQFQSDIRVHHGTKKANAKSLISMLTLGAEAGTTIHIVVDGVDEETAMTMLATAVADGLGEAEHINQPTNQLTSQSTNQQPQDGLIRGIAAAPGIAIGPIFQLRHAEVTFTETFGGASAEETRLQTAIEQARGQLAALHQQMLTRSATNEAAIFDVHLEILDDPDLLDTVLGKISQQQPAAQAWQSTIEARAKLIAGLDDPLLAARSADIHDVGYRVLRLLVGADDQGLRLPEHPVIVIAHDLSPSDTASLPKERVLGFCTAVGGPTAHSAIIARALSLPAMVSAGVSVLELANNTPAILDGRSGTLTLNPDAQAIAQAQQMQATWRQQQETAARSAAAPAITPDGHRVEVVANVGGLADTKAAVLAGAEGVGLLRTEFLFLDRAAAPSEEEQFAVYRDIAQAMQGQPVIVRTLDIGGDKPLPYIEVPPEANPFLGERGIRLCLNRPHLLREQVRAILRAAEHGKLRIMFPMIADIGELRAARTIVEEVRAELKVPMVEIGIMIEIPSAALMADALAAEVDFFSVGTNDLTQYTLAMDRQHPSLAGKADGLHPAVLRLIGRTVEAAHAAGKWVGICGELGADPQAVPIFMGLGVDELSVSVPAIPSVKAQIRAQTLVGAKELAQKALTCATAQEVRELVR
ncbi:MAG: phosphoenolpyruvate--protein phosphotransferase [Anaerolinea sp.]|nr:phosphoenolpyruvate--protein phosphotransferase [Anaerolinea sp.]